MGWTDRVRAPERLQEVLEEFDNRVTSKWMPRAGQRSRFVGRESRNLTAVTFADFALPVIRVASSWAFHLSRWSASASALGARRPWV